MEDNIEKKTEEQRGNYKWKKGQYKTDFVWSEPRGIHHFLETPILHCICCAVSTPDPQLSHKSHHHHMTSMQMCRQETVEVELQADPFGYGFSLQGMAWTFLHATSWLSDLANYDARDKFEHWVGQFTTMKEVFRQTSRSSLLWKVIGSCRLNPYDTDLSGSFLRFFNAVQCLGLLTFVNENFAHFNSAPEKIAHSFVLTSAQLWHCQPTMLCLIGNLEDFCLQSHVWVNQRLTHWLT